MSVRLLHVFFFFVVVVSPPPPNNRKNWLPPEREEEEAYKYIKAGLIFSFIVLLPTSGLYFSI
jgi:hypothetical protein